MSARSSTPLHRMSRRAQRRYKVRRAMLWGFACLVLLWAFGAGYLWRQWRAKGFTAPVVAVQATAEQRAEALRLLDEGVRARYEERWQGAMNALIAARRADPEAKGLNVLVGEIALEQKDPETLRQAVQMALRSGQNEASTKLLQSLEIWMKRAEKGVEHAGPQAEQALTEAAQAEPSNASVYFFHGELNRLLGDNDEAQRNLLAALHRQAPWRSSALIEIKMQLAAREAAAGGKAVAVAAPTYPAEEALALHEVNTDNRAESLLRLLRMMPLLQVLALRDDEAFEEHDAEVFSDVSEMDSASILPRSDRGPGQ